MAEIELPVIVTAIANSELESFVAGTLYGQGWSVIYRALDVASLNLFLDDAANQEKNILLIYSPDLPGMTPDFVNSCQQRVRQVIGFSADPASAASFSGILPTPSDVTELVSLIRGFIRAPLLRAVQPKSSIKKRARVISLGGPSGSTGCTTVAINLAMELSVANHEVLLLDGDVRRPSIAALLALRNLDEEQNWRKIAQHFSVGELTKARMPQLSEYMDEACAGFDIVIVDLGAIEAIADSLTDRRWVSTVIHWTCDNADELWLLGKVDILGIHRLNTLIQDLSKVSIRAKVSVLFNMKQVGRKWENREELSLSSGTLLRPHRILSLPKDSRVVSKAQEERATLIEINDRSTLRKAIAKLAVEVMI